MTKVITQTGQVKEEVTVTLTQGAGMAYSITFPPGALITLVVVSHDPPKRAEPRKEEVPF